MFTAVGSGRKRPHAMFTWKCATREWSKKDGESVRNHFGLGLFSVGKMKVSLQVDASEIEVFAIAAAAAVICFARFRALKWIREAEVKAEARHPQRRN